MKSGIYKIYCNVEDKYYIGQSVNVEARLKQHFKELKSNKHINKSLQSDFNKYGEHEFIFEPIEYVKEQYLNVMEGHFIEYYDSLNNGYNIKDMCTRVRPDDRAKINLKRQVKVFSNLNEFMVKIEKGDVYLLQLLESISMYYMECYDYSNDLYNILEKNEELFDSLWCNISDKIYNTIKKCLINKYPYIDFVNIEPSGIKGNSSIDDIKMLVDNNIFYVHVIYLFDNKEFKKDLKIRIKE